ncbi:MAG: hypothetical protein ACKPKO_12605 [Candidatus Fonsibacter sp.]
MPGVLVFGVMSPVDVFSVKPLGTELYVPVVYAPVPVNVTDVDPSVEQNGLT